MPTIIETQSALQAALTASTKAQSDYDAALAKLEPLKTAALNSQREVNRLIAEFQRATGGDSATSKGRRGQKKGPYKISNESKIAASGKRAFTRAVNSGASEKDAKAAQKAAEKALTEKLGVK